MLPRRNIMLVLYGQSLRSFSVRDLDIRVALRAQLEETHKGESDTLIRNELGLCLGQSRVDIAVINGRITGYEIKSERDTLTRLPGQVELYSRVLDEAWIVTSRKHALRMQEHVPPWWGILEAVQEESLVRLLQVQQPHENPQVDPYSVAQLIWREEAFAVLERYELAGGLRRATRFKLWEVLAENLPPQTLAKEVRSALKARQHWSGG